MANRERIVANIVNDQKGAYIANSFDDGLIDPQDHDGFFVMWYYVMGVPFTVQVYTNVSQGVMANLNNDALVDAFAESHSKDGLVCYQNQFWEEHDPATNRRVAAAVQFLTSWDGKSNMQVPLSNYGEVFPSHVLVLLEGSLMDHMDVMCQSPLSLSPLGPDFSVLSTEEPMYIAYNQIGQGDVNPAAEAAVWSTWVYRHHALIDRAFDISVVMAETPTGWVVTYISEKTGTPHFCVVQISRLIEGGQSWTPAEHHPAFDETSILHEGVGDVITNRSAIYRGFMTTWQAYVAWAADVKARERITIPTDFVLDSGRVVTACEVYDHAADLDLVEPRVAICSPCVQSPVTEGDLGLAGALVPFAEGSFGEPLDNGFKGLSDDEFDSDDEDQLDTEQAKALEEVLDRLGSTEATIDDFMACNDATQIFTVEMEEGRFYIGDMSVKNKYTDSYYTFYDGYHVSDLMDICGASDDNSAFISAVRAAKHGVYPSEPQAPAPEQAQKMREHEVDGMSCEELSALLKTSVTPATLENSREHAVALMALAGTIPGFESLRCHYTMIMNAGTMGAQDTGGTFLETLHRATSDRLLTLVVKESKLDGKMKYAATINVKAHIHRDIAALMESGAVGVDSNVLSDYIVEDHCAAYAPEFATEAMHTVITPYKKAQINKIIEQLHLLDKASPDQRAELFGRLESGHRARADHLAQQAEDILGAVELLWTEEIKTRTAIQIQAIEAEIQAINAQIENTTGKKRVQQSTPVQEEQEPTKRAHTLRRRRDSSSDDDSDSGGEGSSRLVEMTPVF